MSKSRGNFCKRATDLFSKIVRQRAGFRCQAFMEGRKVEGGSLPCSAQVQCAHLKSRRYGAIRTDFRNAICLCAAHHRYFTDNPDEWTEFIERKFPGRWDELRQERFTVKIDWEARYNELKELAE